ALEHLAPRARAERARGRGTGVRPVGVRDGKWQDGHGGLLTARPSRGRRGCDPAHRASPRLRYPRRPFPFTAPRPGGLPVRSDLDRLMQQRGLAGLVVLALDRYSPAFYYCTGQKIHHGFYVRTADGRAHLVHDPMERDQAALVGCETSSY